MATNFTLNVSIPDADVPDVIAAVRQRYATNGVPNPTNAQLRAAMESEWRQMLATITLQYRRQNAAVAPPALS